MAVLTSMCLYARAQRPDNPGPALSGIVTDTTGAGISGATVSIKGTGVKTISGSDGRFTLRAPDPKGMLVVSYVAHQTITEKFDIAAGGMFHFTLVPVDNLLEEVEVVSTGYQIIPKERATGSFVHIDNELLNRSVGSNVLDRLRGVTRGLIFNDVQLGSRLAVQPSFSIRGRSTLFANAEPLIILDNFPFEGDINAINPEGIASVTVLQDAAASSIWGAYAGNGVVVLTSKSGRYGQRTKVSVNANLSISEKPNLYYVPTIPIATYIDEVEGFLFDKGAWDGRINQIYPYITPVIADMAALSDGSISESELDARLNQLKKQDVRKDLLAYAFRPTALHKIAVNVTGGSPRNRHMIAVGYDKNLGDLRSDVRDRINVSARNGFRLLENKMEVDATVLFAKNMGRSGSYPQYGVLYDRLADENGIPLSIGGRTDFRQSYIDTAGGGMLKDWNYRPLDEIYTKQITDEQTTYQLGTSLSYRPWNWIEAKLAYRYGYGNRMRSDYDTPDSYTIRSDANKFSQLDAGSGAIVSAIPDGGRLAWITDTYQSNHLRGQINITKEWRRDHQFDAVLGGEINLRNTLYQSSSTWHGYQKETETYTPVDYNARYAQYHTWGQLAIPGRPNATRETTTDRNRLYFANVSYAYAGRYTITMSARKDASNIFGVRANRRGRPFWSVGALWNVHLEPFYDFDWLTKLSIRLTNGYGGNVSKSRSAYVTATVNGRPNSLSGHTYQDIINPPNPQLGWEKVRMTNMAIEFETFGGILSGTVEHYVKHAEDLLSNVPYHPSSGITRFYGNWSSMKGRGWDVTLHSRNLEGALTWSTDLIFSQTADRVTEYKPSPSNNNAYLTSSIGTYPVVGKPMHALFSLPWAGLDDAGQPQGYINGEISQDYVTIYTQTPLTELKYHGPATPSFFGGLMNSFAYKGMTLSFNITYKLGYYFRRNGVLYSALFSPGAFDTGIFHAEYMNRWRQLGDERTTQVPAAIYPGNVSRDNFYKYSSALVEPADHIRLNDIRIGYRIQGTRWKIQNIHVYLYASNLGILWRSNDYGIDPDMVPGMGLTYPSPKNYALGINLNF